MTDESKEHLLSVSGNTWNLENANKLRSALVKNVRHAWIYVRSSTKCISCANQRGKTELCKSCNEYVKTKKFEQRYDVYIANEWGGAPSFNQKEHAKSIVDEMNAAAFTDEITQEIDLSDFEEVRSTISTSLV